MVLNAETHMFYFLKCYSSSWYGFGTELSLKVIPDRIKGLEWLKNFSHLLAATRLYQLSSITYACISCPCWSKAQGMGHQPYSTDVISKGIDIFLLIHSALYHITLKYMYALYTHRSHCSSHVMNSPHPILDIRVLQSTCSQKMTNQPAFR